MEITKDEMGLDLPLKSDKSLPPAVKECQKKETKASFFLERQPLLFVHSSPQACPLEKPENKQSEKD